MGGRKVPIQVRAQTLREAEAAAAMPGRAPLAEQDTIQAAGERRRLLWRQADVKRAIAAAEQAGLASYRIEIAPDGTITIVVGAPEGSPPPDPYRDLLNP